MNELMNEWMNEWIDEWLEGCDELSFEFFLLRKEERHGIYKFRILNCKWGKESLKDRLSAFFFQPINTVIERDEEKMKIQSAINVGMENNGENLQVGRWQFGSGLGKTNWLIGYLHKKSRQSYSFHTCY